MLRASHTYNWTETPGVPVLTSPIPPCQVPPSSVRARAGPSSSRQADNALQLQAQPQHRPPRPPPRTSPSRYSVPSQESIVPTAIKTTVAATEMTSALTSSLPSASASASMESSTPTLTGNNARVSVSVSGTNGHTSTSSSSSGRSTVRSGSEVLAALCGFLPQQLRQWLGGTSFQQPLPAIPGPAAASHRWQSALLAASPDSSWAAATTGGDANANAAVAVVSDATTSTRHDPPPRAAGRSRALSDSAGAVSTGSSTSAVSGSAEAYLVLGGGGGGAAAAGYGIDLQYTSVADAGLEAALASVLPTGVTLLTGAGVTTVTWNKTAAAAAAAATASGSGSGSTAVPPSLDGASSYLELRIPAPGLDARNAFGCLSYNVTSNSLRSASGNLTGVPTATGAVAAPPALYDNATARVICRVTSVAGSYVVAQQTAAAAAVAAATTNTTGGSGSGSGSSSTAKNNRTLSNSGEDGVGRGDSRSSTEGLIVASVVGGIMAVPLTMLGVGMWVMRQRRRREQAAAQQQQQQQGDSRQPASRSGSSSRGIQVHPLKEAAV
ncbi:hypothetical protein PLESTB_000631700 [Pleodorina starrii]|uniref:Uncharacterized protein n=1 Tax=Pleodorina starrii TaxID=330485 RepID=A0A9W6BIY3_9CHLO|nr:hypothetical protein PLESTB_000631700 [Pleodorina starrii]GLC69709.1 hypothetical protein PLESTF_000868800 [Pleodorina starrii]